jgi:hypothetical protein
MGKAARKARQDRNRAEAARTQIVVGAIGSDLRAERELNLVKPALIYGDRVVLHSPVVSTIASLQALGDGDSAALIAAVAPFAIAAGTSSGGEFNTAALEQLEMLLPLAQLSDAEVETRLHSVPLADRAGVREAIGQLRQATSGFGVQMQELDRVVTDMATGAGLPELQVAVDRGFLTIADAGIDGSDDSAEHYIANLSKHFDDPRSQLLVDDLVGGVLSQLGDMPDHASRRARQASVGSALLGQLPAFEQLTIAEILDVRAELEPAVIRFRGAVGQFETQIASSDLGSAELDADIENLWNTTVAPELLELRARIDDNRLLRQLLVGSAQSLQAIATPIAGGLVCLAAGNYIDIQPALLAAAGFVAPIAIRRKTEATKQQRHRLYLLHEVSEEVAKRHG